MACPRDAIGNAIRKCPFLHQVSADQGEDYARKIATRPSLPATSAGHCPVFEERSCDFEATLKLFHGTSGVVPLGRVAASLAESGQACQSASRSSSNCRSDAHRRPSQQRCNAPFASMNLAGAFSFLPGPHDVANLLFGKKELRLKNVRKPSHSKSTGHSSTNTTQGPVSARATAGAQQSGQCPLRKFPGAQIVGGLIPLSAKGKLQCPRAIVAGRAFVARLQPVRELRPQALPVKLATLGAGTSLLNVPFGMWREHTRKFSPEWFLAVHATIPFVAMTRQGIGMPKTVIFLTIGSAILGQALGARLERQRLLLMDNSQDGSTADLRRVDSSSNRAAVQSSSPITTVSHNSACQSHDGLLSRSGSHIMSLAHSLTSNNLAAVGA